MNFHTFIKFLPWVFKSTFIKVFDIWYSTYTKFSPKLEGSLLFFLYLCFSLPIYTGCTTSSHISCCIYFQRKYLDVGKYIFSTTHIYKNIFVRSFRSFHSYSLSWNPSPQQMPSTDNNYIHLNFPLHCKLK